jgi:hypothetical protein
LQRYVLYLSRIREHIQKRFGYDLTIDLAVRT